MKNLSAGNVPGTLDGMLRGKVVWRDGVMTTTALFELLEAHLAARGRGPEGRNVLARLSAGGLDVAGSVDLSELVRSCERSRRSLRVEGLVAALCVLAPTDPVAVVAIVVVLRPDLVRQARRLVRAGLAPDEAVAVAVEAVVVAVGAMSEGDGGPKSDEAVVRALLNAVWRRCRTEARRAERLAARQVPLSVDEVDRPAAGGEPEVDDPLLARAVRRGALDVRQARLLYETRGLGRPVVEVAEAWGVGPGTLVSSRRRAEHRLRAMLVAEGSERSR